MTEILHVVACVSNPLRWQSRIALARAAIAAWLAEPNVHVTLAECAYGSRAHDLADLASDRVSHIPLRATTMAWSKENLLNLAVAALPPRAQKIATLDADVTFRRKGWATETLAALDLYPVVQPWDAAYDLGPHDEHIQTHRSFASVWHAGGPVVPMADTFWSFSGGPYAYPHPGYAWAWTRRTLDHIGGLFEDGGMGSGDHHMALGLVGRCEASLPSGVATGYRNAVCAWGARAAAEINGKLGFVHGTIEHPFHGRKGDRGYQSRWAMFLEHGFDPATDLKRNTQRVIEFSGSKPDLERAFDRYLRAREEDVNTLT
ncbi:hypothetical protein DFR50_107123 [Roseiarcus fermentans]|uniref:Glycosyl transferase family 2 n=1 Tax=Roseiarcus fermentans TaxID=1473586 RepID=A0A366FMC4_9HYPH|nr:hypothetical protein [Roseiarcus fermentans]RBP15853.1 hypothetical protein DFR50_107123 [Roseiarcus fermentans]